MENFIMPNLFILCNSLFCYVNLICLFSLLSCWVLITVMIAPSGSGGQVYQPGVRTDGSPDPSCSRPGSRHSSIGGVETSPGQCSRPHSAREGATRRGMAGEEYRNRVEFLWLEFS